MQRGVAVVVDGGDVGARLEELSDRRGVSEPRRDEEGGDAGAVDVRARLEEGVDEAAVTLSGCVEERARAELVGGVHVGAGLEEGVDDAAVAVEGGEDEGGVAAVVRGIHVRARANQRVGHQRAPVLRAEVQRPRVIFARAGAVDVHDALGDEPVDLNEPTRARGLDELVLEGVLLLLVLLLLLVAERRSIARPAATPHAPVAAAVPRPTPALNPHRLIRLTPDGVRPPAGVDGVGASPRVQRLSRRRHLRVGRRREGSRRDGRVIAQLRGGGLRRGRFHPVRVGVFPERSISVGVGVFPFPRVGRRRRRRSAPPRRAAGV
mmetsp:Transcript_13785/g.60204  ORF Transcript_13785/g.60204 Transcript_13785/m.60204 type:complete len:321 (-) Transcript_13785:1298-2260(-)